MEAPKPISFSYIKKELTSEKGDKCVLQIYFDQNKFEFSIEKAGKIFKDKFKKEYSMNQIQENNYYFKLFSNPQEILEEINERLNYKTPILTELENNSINLIIFLQNSKYKQAEFNLLKENVDLNKEDFTSIIEKLYNSMEELKKENIEIKKKLKELENKQIVNTKRNNFRWINDEVNIVNNSKFHQDFDPEIMIGKKNKSYSFTDGNRNHFVEFSFNKIYYLKAIRISVHSLECSLKTFQIEIISSYGERYNIGTFIRSKYEDNKGFEEFKIDKECKGIKLYLVDNWGKGGGNYILIKRIDFNVID